MIRPHFVPTLEVSQSIMLLHQMKQQSGGQNIISQACCGLNPHGDHPTEIQGSQQTSQSNTRLWKTTLFICCGLRGVTEAAWQCCRHSA